jgi:hypothetical protein
MGLYDSVLCVQNNQKSLKLQQTTLPHDDKMIAFFAMVSSKCASSEANVIFQASLPLHGQE